jgi:WD40 repeat protein
MGFICKEILIQTGKLDTRLKHPDFVRSVTVASSGHVITGCRDESIRVWDDSVII